MQPQVPLRQLHRGRRVLHNSRRLVPRADRPHGGVPTLLVRRRTLASRQSLQHSAKAEHVDGRRPLFDLAVFVLPDVFGVCLPTRVRIARVVSACRHQREMLRGTAFGLCSGGRGADALWLRAGSSVGGPRGDTQVAAEGGETAAGKDVAQGAPDVGAVLLVVSSGDVVVRGGGVQQSGQASKT